MKENVCFEEGRRESIKENEKKAVDMSQDVSIRVTRSYKDGLQPESLADGNWLVKQYQPVSKIETKSDTNLRSLYES